MATKDNEGCIQKTGRGMQTQGILPPYIY